MGCLDCDKQVGNKKSSLTFVIITFPYANFCVAGGTGPTGTGACLAMVSMITKYFVVGSPASVNGAS